MRRSVIVVLVGVVICFGACGSAFAHIVSGQVVDESGFGVFNVDLDFFDRNLGQIIFTPGDNTDANGFYSVDVPASEYDITYNAPTGSPFLDVEIRVDIFSDTLFDITLPVGHGITGWVTDQGNAPLFNVDLNFVDIATGDIINTNDDNTDLFGAFNILVPAATYDIRFTPPLGQPYAGAELKNIVITGPMSLDTTQLAPGFFLSGTVRDLSSTPVPNVDLDFEDQATGLTLYTPRDNSDSNGDFGPSVAAGIYDIVFNPPIGSGLAHVALNDFILSADSLVSSIVLPPGFVLSGTVVDQTLTPLVGADLDMIDISVGFKIPTDKDKTVVGGAFQMIAPAETMDIYVNPPVGMPLASTVLHDQIVAGPMNLGTITLLPGFRIFGHVWDTGVNPIPGSDIDIVEQVGGFVYPTPGDDTDGGGAYELRVPGGAYLVIANPPAGSGLLPDTVMVSPLAGDTQVDFFLSADPSVGVGSGAVPSRLSLLSNQPNPFNPTTRIRFILSHDGYAPVSVRLYGANGQQIRTLHAGPLEGGTHELTWDGRDDSGRPVPSGVYLYRLDAGKQSESRKMVLVR